MLGLRVDKAAAQPGNAAMPRHSREGPLDGVRACPLHPRAIGIHVAAEGGLQTAISIHVTVDVESARGPGQPARPSARAPAARSAACPDPAQPPSTPARRRCSASITGAADRPGEGVRVGPGRHPKLFGGDDVVPDGYVGALECYQTC